jgi:hypothetical protein
LLSKNFTYGKENALSRTRSGVREATSCSLWTKPEKNPVLTKAIKQRRVLTVIREPGKRNYGILGFELRPGALRLVFPKPLPRGEPRVVGIDLGLVE